MSLAAFLSNEFNVRKRKTTVDIFLLSFFLVYSQEPVKNKKISKYFVFDFAIIITYYQIWSWQYLVRECCF